ncbi:MAG: AI-2E family transporter [Acidobacteriota bacterium]|nr:AI-2E family transporter [Acidobacteriota bacterium]
MPTLQDNPETSTVSPSRSLVRSHILFGFAIALALALAWHLRETLTLLYVSALFAVVLTPIIQSIVDFEMRGGRRISRSLAIALLLCCVLLGLGVLLFLGVPPVARDMHQFGADLPKRLPGILARVKRLPLADKLGVDEVANRAEGALSSTAAYLLSSLPKLMGSIFSLVTGLILCVYFMLEGDSAYQWALSLVPEGKRRRLDTTLQRAELRVSKWLLGQGLLMLILGVTSTLVFGFLHVRYFFLLGVLMGLMNLIPIAGGVITILLAAGVAALDSWAKMSGVFIFYAIYVNIENAFLTPRIMRSSVNLMGLTVLIALLAGTELAGIVGALVAVPTAAVIAVLLDEYVVQSENTPDGVAAAKTISNKLPH